MDGLGRKFLWWTAWILGEKHATGEKHRTEATEVTERRAGCRKFLWWEAWTPAGNPPNGSVL
jgi:hypothetical protein